MGGGNTDQRCVGSLGRSMLSSNDIRWLEKLVGLRASQSNEERIACRTVVIEFLFKCWPGITRRDSLKLSSSTEAQAIGCMVSLQYA